MDKPPSTARALRRARAAAWIVFLSMAGTTMTFQVFHSIKYGHMPWPLAALYGVVPLLIAICILEFVSEWQRAPWWAKTGAYLIMGGAMYLSAAATGAVVLHAAPAHMSGLFGVLMDAAALLAVHFILNGPRAASTVALARPVAPGAVRAEAIPDAVPGATAGATGRAVAGAAAEAIGEPSGDAMERPSREPSGVPSAEPSGMPQEEPRREPRRPGAISREPEAERARAAYRKSVKDGKPLSDRALGEMFGRSRTWGANRIAECKSGPQLASRTG